MKKKNRVKYFPVYPLTSRLLIFSLVISGYVASGS